MNTQNENGSGMPSINTENNGGMPPLNNYGPKLNVPSHEDAPVAPAQAPTPVAPTPVAPVAPAQAPIAPAQAPVQAHTPVVPVQYETPESQDSSVVEVTKATVGIKVIATREGFYGQQRIAKGESFTINRFDELGEWMKCEEKTMELDRKKFFKKKSEAQVLKRNELNKAKK